MVVQGCRSGRGKLGSHTSVGTHVSADWDRGADILQCFSAPFPVWYVSWLTYHLLVSRGDLLDHGLREALYGGFLEVSVPSDAEQTPTSVLS